MMPDEERIETARRACRRNAYAREHGICLRCKKHFEPNGHTVCPRCRKALNELLAIMRGRR